MEWTLPDDNSGQSPTTGLHQHYYVNVDTQVATWKRPSDRPGVITIDSTQRQQLIDRVEQAERDWHECNRAVMEAGMTECGSGGGRVFDFDEEVGLPCVSKGIGGTSWLVVFTDSAKVTPPL